MGFSGVIDKPTQGEILKVSNDADNHIKCKEVVFAFPRLVFGILEIFWGDC